MGTGREVWLGKGGQGARGPRMPGGPTYCPPLLLPPPRRHLPTTPRAAPATLQLDVQGREGLHADEVVHHARCIGIVGAIMELVNGARWVLEALIPGARWGGMGQQKPSPHPSQPPRSASSTCSLLPHELGMLGVHHTDGLGQVPEDSRVAEVQGWGHVVL